jgi:alanine dehydrogenase
MSPSVLVISGREIDGYVRIKDCLPLVEQAFTAMAMGGTDLPPKCHFLGSRGLWFFMGGIVEPLEAMAIKLGSTRPDNVKRGLPAGVSQVICYNCETAEPLAFMEGSRVTALRTGAAAAVGAKHLARPESNVAGIIGTGRVGSASLEALNECYCLDRVYVADVNEEARGSFVAAARELYPFPVIEASLEQAVRAADILITATPAREPIVKKQWLSKGQHISAMGADRSGKQEIEAAALSESRIVCDNVEQCLEYGELNNAYRAGLLDREWIVGEIGEVILGRKEGRRSNEEITLFDSTGMGIQDAVVAKLIYDTALRQGLGTLVEL